MEMPIQNFINKLQLEMARIPSSRYVGKKICMKFSTHDYYIEGTIENLVYTPESKSWFYLFRYEDGTTSEEDSSCLQSVMYPNEKPTGLKIINSSIKSNVVNLAAYKRKKKL